MNLIDLIPTGKENRISTAMLKSITHLDPAVIRREINKARSDGEPICSDGDGYYYAETPNELNHTIKRMNSRIHKQIRAREGLKKAQRKLEKDVSVR